MSDTHAYVVAQGLQSEAEEDLRLSLAVGYRGAFLPGLAGTLWRAGMALLALERGKSALEDFRRAGETDPKGLFGGLAAKALREHSVWRD